MSGPIARMVAGSRYCGTVGFAVDGAIDTALICQGSNCHRRTGSALKPLAGIPRDRLTVSRGNDRLKVIGDDRVNTILRAIWGSLPFPVVRDGGWGHVVTGALVDATTIRPLVHSFDGSKAPCHDHADGLPQSQEIPE